MLKFLCGPMVHVYMQVENWIEQLDLVHSKSSSLDEGERGPRFEQADAFALQWGCVAAPCGCY